MDLYLTSTATTTNPNNTLSHFTNELPKHLHLPTEEGWGLTVQHISISNVFMLDYHTDVINIECMNIVPVIDSTRFSQIIGSFTYLPDNSGICYHEFYDRAYFKFLTSDVNNITIKLTDLDGEVIKLRDGTITIVKIHIDKMDRDEFHIHCNSNPTKTYPDNKGELFTAELPRPLQLSGDWEVALTSITHPAIVKPLFDNPQYIYWVRDQSKIINKFELRKDLITVEDLWKIFQTFTHIRLV